MGMVKTLRFEVHLVSLDPTIGSEIKKTRPCVIVSPDELNTHLRTVMVAPMTSKRHGYAFRVPVSFQGRKGEIICDQIRTVDKKRLVKKLGRISNKQADMLLERLQEMFT